MKNPNKNKDYPFPDDDIDLYAVDTRIWDRLEGMIGGEDGLHTHPDYADKTHDHPHTHDGYADENHQHIHDHPHDHDGSYAPSGHTHDLTHNHDEFADKDHAHDFTHDHSEYADAQTLADHLANHPSGGDGSGGSYDDTEVRALIQGNTDALDGKSDEGHTHADSGGGGYDDTALKARVETNENDIDALEVENNSQNLNIQANTDALADKADANHTHPPQDLTHNHDNEYQAKGDYASDTHTHPPQDTTHNHDTEYAPIHNHPYAPTTHSHPEYEGGSGGGGSSRDLMGYLTDDYAFTLTANAGSLTEWDKRTYANGVLMTIKSWARSSGTNGDQAGDRLFTYVIPNSGYSVFSHYYTKVDGVVVPLIAKQGYASFLTLIPEQFEEATEDGKQQLIDIIASSGDNGKWSYYSYASTNAEMTKRSYDTPTGILDSFRHKDAPYWLVIDNNKVVWGVQTPNTTIEGQPFSNTRVATPQEIAEFEAPFAEERARQARVDAFLEGVANE